MPTGSTLVIALTVLALCAMAVVWCWTTRKQSNKSEPSKSEPNDEIADPTTGKRVPSEERVIVFGPVPDLFDDDPNSERESDPDVTKMGTVPDEVLDLMKEKISAEVETDIQEEERDLDIDIQELVDNDIDGEPTGPHALILVVGVARSDRGRRRKCNEDAFLILEEQHIFVVADGMGGHNAGDIASQTAVDVMAEAFKTNLFPGPSRPEWPRRGDELVRTIHHANRVVFDLSLEKEEYKGMGTTVVSVRFSPNKQRAYIAHVGDSRCYRIRRRELHQLTEDHTLGRLLGVEGKAARHLAQAVGVRPDIAVDLTVDEPQPGDHYLVCSDGMTKMVPDKALLELALADDDLEERCRALVDEANERGGRDNITVIMIRVEDPVAAARRTAPSYS